MKPSLLALSTVAAWVPTASAWGGFGHITIAYLATSFLSPPTTSYLQALLRNSTEDYLAGVATWADSFRYSKYGRFTANFHFIDAKDSPPTYCGVDFDRDCKSIEAGGCVITALQNYTTRMLDTTLSGYERAVAAKFVVHFVGDIHQPLHTENVARGGNGIHVRFEGREFNLHHVWDTSIAEKLVGGIHRKPYPYAKKWADELAEEIKGGKFKDVAEKEWLKGVNVSDAKGTAMDWAKESNKHVCSVVLPQGPKLIEGQELGSDYYEAAAPVVEVQIARAGYRLAAWLEMIVSSLKNETEILGSEESSSLSTSAPRLEAGDL
ncbi:putative nuclease S1 precursor [Podospora australis]|uniref:Nuclease S1 n=1 Tax=Podospora australis TaxID=1536484 RepID=A0AAN6X741_9PEZI|nr:putative nuclease S1 precursor [Podospora australis]